MLSHFTLVWLLATSWTVACKAPQSMGFQTGIQSRLPFSPPWDLLDQGIEPTSLTSPTLTGGFFITSSTWEAILYPYQNIYHLTTMHNSPTLWFWSERAWSWIRVPGSTSGLGKKKKILALSQAEQLKVCTRNCIHKATLSEQQTLGICVHFLYPLSSQSMDWAKDLDSNEQG